MRLEAGQQGTSLPDVVEELRRQRVAGLGSTRGFYAGPLFVVAEGGDMSGDRDRSQDGLTRRRRVNTASSTTRCPSVRGLQPKEAWVDGLQQNQENRSNLALVNTGEVDGSASVFHLEIYDGETGIAGRDGGDQADPGPAPGIRSTAFWAATLP